MKADSSSGKRILVVGNGDRPAVKEAAFNALPIVRAGGQLAGVDLSADSDLGGADADLILAFGGDGTILAVARRLRGAQIPVLGVNLGRTGFLAEVSVDPLAEGLENVLSGRTAPTPRMMLEVNFGPDGQVLALNDVVVTRGATSRMLSLEVRVDDVFASQYDGDGVIVSTPTGSTAYSLSAGGPLVSPELNVIILTPICPHAASSRPIVVGGGRTVEIRLRGGYRGAHLTVDGQLDRVVEPTENIRVRRAERPFLLIDFGWHRWFQTVRSKLHWTPAKE